MFFAPTPVCVLFSGTMVELGLYAVARVYWTIFSNPFSSHENAFRGVLLGACVLTALLGGVMCFAQRHLKRLLAYSTVSHMGLMLMGFALLSRGGLAGQALDASLGLLRRIHSGEAGDYVAWLTGGVAVFGALFLSLFR